MNHSLMNPSSTRLRRFAQILLALMLLFASMNSHAVTCNTLPTDPNDPNHPNHLTIAALSPVAQVPGPTVNPITHERGAFLNHPSAPGGYFGAILSDGHSAHANRNTSSKPAKTGSNNKPLSIVKNIRTLNAITKKKKDPKLKITFKQGHLVNSWVGGNPNLPSAYTILTAIANRNHESTVESLMKNMNRLIRKHYFTENDFKATAKDFVAEGTNGAGKAVSYSPAYYYEMTADRTRTVWDERATLMPSWKNMGFKKSHLKKLPAYYDMTIRFVMVEYEDGKPNGNVLRMPNGIRNQFLNDIGIELPDYSGHTGSTQIDGFHYRPAYPAIGTSSNSTDPEIKFRLRNLGY